MPSCPFTHPLDLEAYREGMPYSALAEARERGSFVYYEDADTGVPYWAAVKRDALDFVSQNPSLFSSQVEGPFPMEPPDLQHTIRTTHNEVCTTNTQEELRN